MSEEQKSVFVGVSDEVVGKAILDYVKISHGDSPSSDWLRGFRKGYRVGKEEHIHGSDVKKLNIEGMVIGLKAKLDEALATVRRLENENTTL